MSVQFALTKDFEPMSCGECGIDFYVPYWFYKERKDHGKGWVCPNGHHRVYREPDNERLQRELDATKQRLEIAKNDAHRETQLRMKAEDAKRRLEKRIQKGVCPHCHRSFPNVRRHMETKHPE